MVKGSMFGSIDGSLIPAIAELYLQEQDLQLHELVSCSILALGSGIRAN